MSWDTHSYLVRVRCTVIAEVRVATHGWSEADRRRRAIEVALTKSRQIQLKNARRPVAGADDFEVLTIEPISSGAPKMESEP